MNTAHIICETIALNAEAGTVPDWINVIPKGPGVRGIDGRAWTMNDAGGVIDTFRRRGVKLPVDVEHATQIKGARGEAAPAMGYVTDLEARETGLWAKVDWNTAGETLLRDRSYAHVSPVFAFDGAQVIRRLVSVGLTNNPNLDLVAMNAAGQFQGAPFMDKAVLEALGLNADATAADAVVAITNMRQERTQALNAAQTPDPAAFVPMAEHKLALNRVESFEQAEQTRRNAAIETAVDTAIEAGKFTPADREDCLAMCRAEGGLERFERLSGNRTPIVGPARTGGKGPVAAPAALDETELAMCRATGMSAEDFLAQKTEETSR
ncbi:phage protease [Profundibacterium mesophilum]|uniref:Mu phage protease GpI n=1 Tax=Profundibacterium mesophilum KAUST100406-0324 TaxID=1037889 RepID=A0A921NRY2_9RHOB|nr:phage protease [Profundibacterium mesophilum]KAF0676745.1 Mu phage protease GpI [Profundibacterium mesophilum KAUST100406-0324]